MPSKPLLKIVGEDADKEDVLPQRRAFGDEERGIASQSVASHHRSVERMSVPQVLSTVICLVALVWPGLSAASYLIQLRNGRQVATSQYWKDGQTIKFYSAGGVGGVPESAVLRIQTVEDPPESDLAGASEQKATPQVERQVASQAEQKATTQAEQKATPQAEVQIGKKRPRSSKRLPHGPNSSFISGMRSSRSIRGASQRGGRTFNLGVGTA